MEKIKILYVEDEEEARDNFKEYFEGMEFDEYELDVDLATTFEEGLTKVDENWYNIIVLDLCDDSKGTSDRSGSEVLALIQNDSFTPVIFYTGHAPIIKDIESNVVRVLNKGTDGVTVLESTIKEIITLKLSSLRDILKNHVDSTLNSYFWGVVHPQRDKFPPSSTDYSLGYLFLRRVSVSLSTNGISRLLRDNTISGNKIHPIEYYIYPTDTKQEYQTGEIIFHEDKFFMILTPSCDLQERFTVDGESKGRKVENIYVSKLTLFSELQEYKDYKSNPSTGKKKRLGAFVENNASTRYYFLPETFFLPNLLVDFKNIDLVPYDELTKYSRVALLDSPYTESMYINYLTYYSRIGTPDLDTDYILNGI